MNFKKIDYDFKENLNPAKFSSSMIVEISDRLCFVCYYLQQSAERNKDNEIEGFISCSFLRNIFRRSLTSFEVIKVLSAGGFVECVRNEYRNSGKKKYTLKRWILTEKLMNYTLVYINSKRTNNIIFNNLSYLHNDNINLASNLQHFIIKISESELVTEIENYNINSIEEFNNNPNKKNETPFLLDENDVRKNIIDVWNSSTESPELIKISKDGYSGRRHTLISYEYSFLRKYLVEKDSNKHLVELDFKSFQPLLLAIILNDIQSGNKYSKFFYKKENDIYNFLGGNDRKKGKKSFMNLVFGYTFSKKQAENNPFAKKFPTEYEIIKQIKQDPNSILPVVLNIDQLKKCEADAEELFFNKKKSSAQIKTIFQYSPYYKCINYLLQKYEVQIFERIWKRLLKENIAFIPLHDAIYVVNEHRKVEKVHKIMTEEMNKELFSKNNDIIKKKSKIKFTIKISDCTKA